MPLFLPLALLSQTEKSLLTAIVGGKERPKDHSMRIVQNFAPVPVAETAGRPDLVVISRLMP